MLDVILVLSFLVQCISTVVWFVFLFWIFSRVRYN